MFRFLLSDRTACPSVSSPGDFSSGGPGYGAALKDLAAFACFLFLFFRFLHWTAGETGYHWQWYRIPRYLFIISDGRFLPGPLLDGLVITLKITGISLILATFIGLGTALMRITGTLPARILSRVYLESIRNTPLLVQIFFIYFVLGPILDIHRFTAAILALSLFEGAYASEIFRGGILSIPRGQWEASLSLGMTKAQTYRHIILPQAFLRILPPIAGQAVSLIKDSALVSAIAISDLTMQGQAVIAETYLTFELWFTIAGLYLLLTLPLSLGVRLLEKWMTPAA